MVEVNKSIQLLKTFQTNTLKRFEFGNVQVCVSGTNPGEYHGVIILRAVQEDSTTCPSENACLTSIFQMGYWVKLTVNGVPDPIIPLVQTITEPAKAEPVVVYYRSGNSYCKRTTTLMVNSKGVPLLNAKGVQRTSVKSVCSNRPIK